MQISSRFTIAVHIFACISVWGEERKLTSDFIASSVNVNPVIIRKLMSQLKEAGLIQVNRGVAGISITRPLDEITFLDIYKALECVGNNELFHFHEHPNEECLVGCNIHNVLDDKLIRVQQAMEDELKSITLQDVGEDLKKYIN